MASTPLLRGLFATTLLAGAVTAMAPALAQSAPAGGSQNGQNSAAPVAALQGAPNAGQVSPNGAGASNEVVVTGTILRRKLSATDAPITTVTSTDLTNRGITTVADGVQQISANSAGALPNSFSSNGAFAAGASAVSLRGLTTNSTLTLIDGLRTAYYPLADDGTRNFVDLNTIPDVIVDQIQVLKDGASATYGADAIAGVVNVITKHTFEGVNFKAEGGATQHGGGGENNYQLLVGHGNLRSDGYNVYLGLEYQHDDALYNHDRGYPYNTSDQSQTCGVSLIDGSHTCRQNTVVNGIQFDNSFLSVGSTIVPVVRPFAPDGMGGYTPDGDYRLLNQAAGCGGLKAVTITPDQANAGGATGITAPVNLCQQDFVHDYNQISPDDKRFSASLRFTKRINENTEAYFTANYYQNNVLSRPYTGPSSAREQATPGAVGIAPYSTAGTPGLVLPVYVCASGVNCNATNGMLNPNNPYAAQGDVASIRYLFGDIPASTNQFVQTYRFATGIKGDFNLFGDWHYSVDATGAQSDLRNTTKGAIFINGLLNAVNTGAYNFVNPSLNTQTVRDMISPTVDQYSTSKLGMVQANLSRDLFMLPGGPLQLGISGAVRYESIFNPSSNPEPGEQMSTNRFFGINPFGAAASRNVRSGSFELDAPLLQQIDIDVQGRYDDYSTGQDNFSPRVGGRIKPFAGWAPQFDKVTLRSSYSQGFRIPSFAESDALGPITGFTTGTAPLSFQTLHNNDGYGQGYNLGLQQVANPNLKPERSDNFTAGIVLDPIPQISLSFDFYRIKKRDFITPDTSNLGAAEAAYYAGTPIPAGYTTIPGIPDPNVPNALPTLGFVTYQFTNLGTETTSGYDIGGTARFTLPYDIHYTSVFDGNYVLRLNLDPMNGSPTQHYAGTIGPFNDVAAGGTPKFRANWQNTLQYGPATVSITAYFTDGYQLQAEDQGDVTGVCIADGASASAINTTYLDGTTPVRCKVKPFWNFDAHAAYDVTKHFQFYVDILNLLDENAPYDPTTYGGTNYNATFANSGIYGRAFKVGLRATF